MSKAGAWVLAVVALLVGLGGGFWYGESAGRERAAADVEAQQEELAKKAGEDAAKAANPFQTVNPLEGVEANPFESAKKALNPFAK
jgi:hypothetical protein